MTLMIAGNVKEQRRGLEGSWGGPAQICLLAKVQETDGVGPQGPRTFWE